MIYVNNSFQFFKFGYVLISVTRQKLYLRKINKFKKKCMSHNYMYICEAGHGHSIKDLLTKTNIQKLVFNLIA